MKNSKDHKNNINNIPNDNPSKAMDSRKEVERSNDAKIDQDLPGYPHHPAKETAMTKRTESHRPHADVENIPSGTNESGVNGRFNNHEKEIPGKNPEVSGSNQDVSDRKAGGSGNLEIHDSENQETGKPQNVSNEDLENKESIPGSPSIDENDSFNTERI